MQAAEEAVAETRHQAQAQTRELKKRLEAASRKSLEETSVKIESLEAQAQAIALRAQGQEAATASASAAHEKEQAAQLRKKEAAKARVFKSFDVGARRNPRWH